MCSCVGWFTNIHQLGWAPLICMGEILQAHSLTNWAKSVATKRPKLDLSDYRQQWAQMCKNTTSDMNDLALDKPSLVWLTMAPGEKPPPVQHWWLSRRLRDHFTLALQLVPCIVILHCSEDWGIISRSKWLPPQSQHNITWRLERSNIKDQPHVMITCFVDGL